MIVYYRRIVTYQRYPNNDLIDTDFVYFSTSKNKFNERVFIKCEPLLHQKERLKLVARSLGVSVNKIELVKS